MTKTIASKWPFDEDELRRRMGAVAPFVPKVFSTWYPLPGTLLEDLRAYEPDGSELELDPLPNFEHILTEALYEAHMSVQYSKPNFHNLRHFVEIIEAFLEQLTGYEELTGQQTNEAIKQAILFALALHDCGHSGCTFRSQYSNPEKLFRAELGTDVSTESVSMIEADEQAKRVGFTPPLRALISYIIACTTSWGKTPEGKRIGIDHIEPTDPYGCMAQLADVYLKSTTAQCCEDCAVVLGETQPTKKPKSFKEMIAGRFVFLDHVESLMDKVDATTGVKVTKHVQQRRKLADLRDCLNSIGTNTIKGAVNGAIFKSLQKAWSQPPKR